MARKNPERRQVTISLTEEDSSMIDQFVFSMGLEGRAAAALTLMRMGLSAVPNDAMVFETCRQAVNQTRRHIFGETAEFFERMAKSYRDGMK